MKHAKGHGSKRVLPKVQDDLGDRELVLQSFDDLYGYRPRHKYVFYLSPWEFAMWWEVLPRKTREEEQHRSVLILEYPAVEGEAQQLHPWRKGDGA